MKIEKTFGDLLRILRTNLGLSQEKFGHEAGLDRTYISLLERGLRQPSLSTIISISKVLKIQPSTLIRLLEEKISENNKM